MISGNYSRKELQQFIVETALAYRHQNPYVQYDSTAISDDGKKRCTSGDAPETAGKESMIYSVCSDFMYDIYRDAFGYELMGSAGRCVTIGMVELPSHHPMVAYKYGAEGHSERDLQLALAASRKVLQPGDMIVGYGTSGHVLMYLGDYKGDGQEYLVHCWGGKVNMDSGFDNTEPAGAIIHQTVDEACYTPGVKPSWYLGAPSHSCLAFSILRPLDDPEFDFQPTPQALTRVKYPGITVRRNLDRDCFLDAECGEKVTVTLSVQNYGKSDFSGIAVTENLPEGQELLENTVTAGARREGKKLHWTLDVPSGKTVSVSYAVRLCGKRGECIRFPEGSVENLTSRALFLTVGGKPLGEKAAARLREYALAHLWDKPEAFESLDFFNRVYREVFGAELGLPKTVRAWTDAYAEVEKRTVGGTETSFLRLRASDDPAIGMVLPKHFTGQLIAREGDAHRTVTEFARCEERYRPGDLFFATFGKNKVNSTRSGEQAMYLYLGDGKVLTCTELGGYGIVPYAESIGLAMRSKLCVALRPTLTMDIEN